MQPSRRIGIAISAVAVALAIAHMIWPHVKIDGVAVVLLALATVPWLAPIFSSIELPGGWRFEYRQIQRDVNEVKHRVGEVERRLQISGATTPDLERMLDAAVGAFAAYLAALEPALAAPLPSVHLQPHLGNAQYDHRLHQIQLDPGLADDPYAVMREFAHHVLFGIRPDGNDGVESGVADYLIASHTGDPRLGVVAVAFFRRNIDGFNRAEVRNLTNTLRFDDLSEGSSPQAVGEVWGGALWDLRESVGQADADRLIAAAWLAAPQPAEFAAALGHHARAILEARGRLPTGRSDTAAG
jgi:hypothetical protein